MKNLDNRTMAGRSIILSIALFLALFSSETQWTLVVAALCYALGRLLQFGQKRDALDALLYANNFVDYFWNGFRTPPYD
ncbi:MAG: hypothetical protein ACK4UW_20485 [Rhizobium rhizophilum]|uniref:hypothetical protein n=1 Tax=Rhizobium rhizophilum TaxID=1850373 RepID=UPI00391AFB39